VTSRPVTSSLVLSPIGIVRTPFKEKMNAPRQAVAADEVSGTIELLPEYEHAISDLEGFDRLWVLYWFHLASGWRPKVLPPRSERRRGLFATRAPHRPNPIGLSSVRLVRIEGLVLHIRGVDMVDESPVLDIKPYVPYADAFPDARTGWLESQGAARRADAGETSARDPIEPYAITWGDEARTRAAWLRDAHGIDLAAPVEGTLKLGPQPHPYRRIKKHGAGFRLAYKDWRVVFRLEGSRHVVIEAIETGYRAAQLRAPPVAHEHSGDERESMAVHRDFVAHFPPRNEPHDPEG